RILRFQLEQLAEEGVILGIGDLRLVEHVILPVRLVDARAQFEDARPRLLQALDRGAHTFTIGARLTARIFIPTRSNFTMISSSVRVMVLFRTAPRPQDRCSTVSPGLKRWTSSTGADGRAASTRRAGAMPGSGIPDGMPAGPSTSSIGMSLRKREGRLRLAWPNRWRRNAWNKYSRSLARVMPT